MEQQSRISVIAAVADNGAIGKDNKLLWHIPEDFKWFKEKTHGHPVIMGRKTFESIGKPLPNRLNIVVSGQSNYQQPGCITASSLEDALEQAKNHDTEEIFIIGGYSLFKEGLTLAHRLYITKIHADFDADVFFPDYSQFTKEVFRKDSSNDSYSYTFLILEKAD